MRFRLRDLFWLTMFVAVATAAGLAHYRNAMELAKLQRHGFFFVHQRPVQPTREELDRMGVVSKLVALTDEELDERFGKSLALHQQHETSEYEFCLAEMVNRKLSRQLHWHYQSLMNRPHKITEAFGENFEMLIALRRSECLPDPVKIHLSLDSLDPSKDAGYRQAEVFAEIECVDSEPIYYLDGCDDRSGRRERWKPLLTDQNGNTAALSNFGSLMAGGVGTSGPLQPGERKGKYHFDLRNYFAPPSSGVYELQMFYHNDHRIADQMDLTGLIVAKSEPITVIVKNPDENASPSLSFLIPSLVTLLAAGILVALLIIRRRQMAVGKPQSVGSRDLGWCLLLVICCAVWAADQSWQQAKIRELRPDSDATWTIELPTVSKSA